VLTCIRTIYYLGMFGGMALATVILVYKPDTRYVRSSEVQPAVADILKHPNLGA
jgi:hypothetical protein